MPRKKKIPQSPFALWISNEYGVKELAKKLKVTQEVVLQWRRMASHPKVVTGARIVALTEGRITLNDIYGYLI